MNRRLNVVLWVLALAAVYIAVGATEALCMEPASDAVLAGLSGRACPTGTKCDNFPHFANCTEATSCPQELYPQCDGFTAWEDLSPRYSPTIPGDGSTTVEQKAKCGKKWCESDEMLRTCRTMGPIIETKQNIDSCVPVYD